MSYPQKQENTPSTPMNMSISSIIILSFFLLVVVGIIFTIMKYALATSAMSHGDYATAAAIMSEGRPVYAQPMYGQPMYGQPYKTKISLF